MNEKIIIGTDALDALESQYGFAIGVDERNYILLQNPIHTELLPEHMVGAMAVPVLEKANIPQGEPVILLWLDMFCAYNAGSGNPLCKGIVLPVGQIITKDVEKTLRQMMWPKDIDSEKLSIRRTEIQAILENDLFETSEDEQMLVYEAEHIDLLLEGIEQSPPRNKKRSCFVLSPESVKPFDAVFAVVKRRKINRLGRCYTTNEYVAVKLTVTSLVFSVGESPKISGYHYTDKNTLFEEAIPAELVFSDWESAVAHATTLTDGAESEKLYLLDTDLVVHIQRVNDEFDYTVYKAGSMKLVDGGRFHETEVRRCASIPLIKSALDTVLCLQNLHPTMIRILDLSLLERLE